MLNYKKYILYSLITIPVYTFFCYLTKRTVDPVIGGLLVGGVVLLLSFIDLRKIKKDFASMKSHVNEYKLSQDAEIFISKQLKLLNETKVPSIKNMIMLNIAGAYITQGDNVDGKKYLDALNLNDFDRVNFKNAVLNKLLLLYKINEDEEANILYDSVFKEDYEKGGQLFKTVKILRFQGDVPEGIKALSKLNMEEGSEIYREVIKMAKEIILENIK
ncbi:MAG: hypothetical protein SPI61_04600 [Ezakiella sp.]|uniref:hypothetical protein n=1 Tax=Ezakiella sp. TaxID=1935205 RepID=UPI0029752555|nr:hypothetical protein [Ezakiella sp.]MDD7731713.1 hypothetical protein [Eubacteriales bacterium]MDY6079981.1 hypothetical protein [Ezakiella sp.]